MKLILLRHCESGYNRDNNLSEKDCGLSCNGITQAVALKGVFKPDMVICSCMARCKETLSHMNVVGVPVLYTDMCREHKQDICDYMKNEESIPESESQLLRRIYALKNGLNVLTRGRGPFHTILVVTHADFIWYFTSHDVQGERFGTWVDNGETVEVVFNHSDSDIKYKK